MLIEPIELIDPVKSIELTPLIDVLLHGLIDFNGSIDRNSHKRGDSERDEAYDTLSITLWVPA